MNTTILWILIFLILAIVFFINKKNIKSSTIAWIMGGILVVILFGFLFFHILPDHFMIFPKEHLTFSNTFINKNDVDKLIVRYNNASFLERQAINQEPLMRKLMEKGIIKEIISRTDSDNLGDSYSYSDNRDEYSNISITAKELYSNYENNAVSADKQYRNKVIRVTGEVSEIASNSYEGTYIKLVAKRFDGVVADCIYCYFSDRHIDEISQINKSQKITIQGKCVEKREYGSIELKNCSIHTQIEGKKQQF